MSTPLNPAHLRDTLRATYGYESFRPLQEEIISANLSGRVLTDLLTGTDSDLTRLPMASHKPLPWEPEPLRSLAVNAVRRSRYRENEKVERTGKYSTRPPLAARVFNR